MLQHGKIRSNFIARNLSRTEILKIKSDLKRLIIDKKLFFNKGFTLKDLANDSGYTIHVLSVGINRSENIHFNAYLNFVFGIVWSILEK